ncbi:zinc ABC transporter ATP-binding protein ZnuC [Geothermobacter hydrogeniphilus]|uniref:Zinc ABC transporter ATP-binding protein ZnuC n=1 Tax=Geothermobacter hydrogeniphilus TaxID=1969733 RepID=A0A2K2H759_9BACT|nr:metal ABC transporter ATP-binding protein [Geothermobacter hydrogeniphilus]PNU19091.1 zinc ABC transporter ATP-binding protein ZnuC [Geothermobacter hydrogeniphilus]
MADNRRTLLELRQVSYARQGRMLVEGVDLRIAAGEILTLIGPNGAGKTTLLKLALGLLPPTSGRIDRFPGLSIGYMPQRLHIDPSFPLSVKRFLHLAGHCRPRQLATTMAETGIEPLAGRAIQNLSGGELQRVLLARALLRNPDLLVLDEPAQGVDVHGQTELYQLLAGLRQRRGCAILMVSHDLHLVMAATDRVVCLNHHVCCTGSPESVSRNADFLTLFGPAAQHNLAFFSHDTDHHEGHPHG